MSRIIEGDYPKCYVVSYSCGQYEDAVEGPVAVFETREAAEDFCKGKENWKKNVEKLAIKDSYNDYDYENDCEIENSSDYTNLYQECQNYWWKVLFGDKTEDDLTDEDWDLYNDKTDTDECLKNYMVEIKGYSQEVADATIAYNEGSDWSEYNTYYHIDEIPFIKK